MQFRKKPIVIEAEQYLVGRPMPRGVCQKACLDGGWIKAHVHTMHKNQAVILEYEDWILPEPDGVHFYPCKPDVFANSYEPISQPDAKSILQEAEETINGPRAEAYGPVKESFNMVAQMWSAITGHSITRKEVGLCMIALKMCRDVNKSQRDNRVDICGYAALLERLE